MHGLEPLDFQSVEPSLPLLADGYQSHFSQHTEMLGNCWLRHPQVVDELTDGMLASSPQQVDDLSSPGFGNGLENIGACGGSWHVASICQ